MPARQTERRTERLGLLALLVATSLSACTRRDAPYRFQAPVVAAVRAQRLPAQVVVSGSSAASPPARRPGAWPAAAPSPQASAPAPPADRVSQALRALVDRPASQGTSAQHALATLASMGAQLDAPLRRVATGADLLALAEARDALTDEPPLTGDLVLIEPAGDADPIVGIVVTMVAPASARGHQITEIIYLADGLVRHGFVTPARTGRRGKAESRAICPDATTPAAHCAAGNRLRSYLRLDRLAR